mmetsp:Transcript_5263/g.10041  ORF Transcript_5263/g.10041 Transcript_5263/m.10041 type:complete len:190 (-) Transcript_5263:2389-2958(-)
MAALDPQSLKKEVFAIMAETPLESLTAKKVRRLVEQKLDVAKGYLDEHKDVVTTFIDEFIKVKNDQEEAAEAAAAGGSDKEQAEDDDDESPRPKKKAKPAAATPEGQAPKGVKSMQCNIMTGREFEKKADRVSIEIFGNKVEGDARTFTSGNRGWYAGKKILVKVGDKQVWAQVGLNITIIGSKEWSDK